MLTKSSKLKALQIKVPLLFEINPYIFIQFNWSEVLNFMAISKTRIRQMRIRIRRILRIQRIWRMAYTIFKRFLSFVYSATKTFISSTKLSLELYLAEGWSKKSGKKIFIPRYLQHGVFDDCVIFLVFSIYVQHYNIY